MFQVETPNLGVSAINRINMKKQAFILVAILSVCNMAYSQTSQKLIVDNVNINIIGTRFSVDYSNNSPSETVNPKSNVFDGKYNTFFASYERSYTWVGLDLGQKHVITQVAYCPRWDNAGRLLLGVIEGANNPDFGDAVPIYMITETPPTNRLTHQTVNNTRGFRYVRYVGPHDARCNIAELEFYGYAGEGNHSQLTQITNIPDVIIHTTNAREITSKTDYIKGIISFVSEEGTKIHTDSLDIRGRGNASWGFEKKPYRIKLYTKAKILGNSAEAKNWTLISNHGDKTLMRNLLAFDISKLFNMPYTPAGQAVNVFLNGEYKGCYQLCDRIDVRKHRVDITEMKPADISGENLTGGYLVEIDNYAYSETSWFTSQKNNIPVTIHSPDKDEIVTQQKNYIRNYFNRFEAAVYASDFRDPLTGYRKYMDTTTFINRFLIEELCGNTDEFSSVYLYKQRGDDKFYFCPVWDFDTAFDNDHRGYPVNDKTDWLYKTGGGAAEGVRSLIDRLLSDSKLYYDGIRDTYFRYRDNGIITKENMEALVDNYVGILDESQKLNFKRWDVIDEWVHMINHHTGSYQREVDILKSYLVNRVDWMDKRLRYVPPSGISQPFPSANIGSGDGNVHISGIRHALTVEIVDLTGRIVYRNNRTEEVVIPLQKGIYLIRISDKTGAHTTTKCVVN
jgi:hypothetical protein